MHLIIMKGLIYNYICDIANKGKLPSKASCNNCNFYLRFVTQVENDHEIE